MNYYKQQLEKLTTKDGITITLSNGSTKTNFMSLNEESIPILIDFLKGLLLTTEPVTIDGLFTWYTGTEDWNEDWQTTNSMLFAGKHAQVHMHKNNLSSARAILDYLYVFRNEEVQLTQQEDDGIVTISFQVNGIPVQIDALTYYNEAV